MNNHADGFYAPNTVSDQSRRVAAHRARRDRVVVVGLIVAAALAVGALFGAAFVTGVRDQQDRVDLAYCSALESRGMTDPARCG